MIVRGVPPRLRDCGMLATAASLLLRGTSPLRGRFRPSIRSWELCDSPCAGSGADVGGVWNPLDVVAPCS
jgi:hypothetical protein